MTPAQVAKIIGCHPGTIRERIRTGALKATRSPVRTGRYFVHRESLIRWLLRSGWEGYEIRKACPMPGPLMTVGIRRELIAAVSQEPRRDYPGMFAAGLNVHIDPPWGIVFDLPNIGSRRVCEEIETYSSQVDRPLLIGLHGDDFVGSPVFDFLIPDSLPPAKIGNRLRALKPWGGH